jgi:lysophospholipase L1-like esterase
MKRRSIPVLLAMLLVAACFFQPAFLFETTAAEPESRFAIPATDEGLPGAGPIRRYEWFRSLWLQKRSGWAHDVQKDQRAVVFLGDSITQGWGDNLGNAFPEAKVANRGISGDTTRGVLIRLEEDVLALSPSGIVLLIGTNDLEEGADPETIAANLKLIVANIKEHSTSVPILLCEVFPSSATKKRPANQIKRINQLYASAVRGDPQITLIQTWMLFANPEGDAKPEEFPDLLHPNATGYNKWAAALRPILATHGFVESQPDNFKPEDGFVSLFNGKDLTGWTFGNGDFTERKATPDGRYVAKNGRLIVTTPPEGSRIQQLWTTEKFPSDFVLRLEFRAGVNADSGIFIREPQLQCRDYYLAGPYKQLKSYRPQEWNQVEVVATNGVAYCTCNGEVLESAYKLPSTGPIGLEGDRGQMEYRRIRLKKLE